MEHKFEHGPVWIRNWDLFIKWQKRSHPVCRYSWVPRVPDRFYASGGLDVASAPSAVRREPHCYSCLVRMDVSQLHVAGALQSCPGFFTPRRPVKAQPPRTAAHQARAPTCAQPGPALRVSGRARRGFDRAVPAAGAVCFAWGRAWSTGHPRPCGWPPCGEYPWGAGGGLGGRGMSWHCMVH